MKWPSSSFARQCVGPISLGIAPCACTILNKLLLLLLLFLLRQPPSIVCQDSSLPGIHLRCRRLFEGADGVRNHPLLSAHTLYSYALPCDCRNSLSRCTLHSHVPDSTYDSHKDRDMCPSIPGRGWPFQLSCTAYPSFSCKTVYSRI